MRKIMYDFNSISNRLLQADFHDYNDVLKKYIVFIKSTPIIYDYIVDCGPCEQNMAEEFSGIIKSYGRAIFDLGESTAEEVRNIFAILNHVVDNNIDVPLQIAGGYSSSNKYQERLKGFNDRVVMVLIRNIEGYLTKIGIDMGLDEKISYVISINHGQVNIASDNAVITATNSIGFDFAQLEQYIANIKALSSELTEADQETLNESLEVIAEETKSNSPRKSFIRTALSGIKTLKGTAEFAAAVAALIEFFQGMT